MKTYRVRSRRGPLVVAGLILGLSALFVTRVTSALEAPVGLGTAESYAILAGAGVTNTGASVIHGSLGTCPTPAISGFPPGIVLDGTVHAADAECLQAQSDLTTAYNDAAGRAPTVTFLGAKDLGGLTLVAGVYKADTFGITGTLTLDAQGDPAAVWIFQAGTTLITAVDSRVVIINGAQACNAFWQVGSSGTLGVNSTFVGTILALTSITANTSATVVGRLLARNGSVTLDSNTVTRPACATTPTTTSSTTSSSSSTTTSTTASPTTTSSTVVPPITLPPITLPPVTLPPITLPPITLPPITLPPNITVPPITLPPITLPPITVPPITLPPVIVPPVTSPPATTSTSTALPATTTTTVPGPGQQTTTTSVSPTTTAVLDATTTTSTTSTTLVTTTGTDSTTTPLATTTDAGGAASAATTGALARTGTSAGGMPLAAAIAIAFGALTVRLARQEIPAHPHRGRQGMGRRSRRYPWKSKSLLRR